MGAMLCDDATADDIDGLTTGRTGDGAKAVDCLAVTVTANATIGGNLVMVSEVSVRVVVRGRS